MKEMTKKILEAGIVDKTLAQLFERWNLLTPEEVALALQPKAVFHDTLSAFIENLEELLSREPPLLDTNKPMRETRFDIRIRKPPEVVFCPSTGSFYVVEDEMGRFICSPTVVLQRGDQIWGPKMKKLPDFTVENIEQIYENDKVIALQITVTGTGK